VVSYVDKDEGCFSVTTFWELAYIVNYRSVLCTTHKVNKDSTDTEGDIFKMNKKECTHFVGIGGVGMSGIARIMLELGYDVSGSDLKKSVITKRLENIGARIYLGHHEDNIKNDVKAVVISSAIPANNSEVVKAKSLGIPVIQRAEMLGELMKRQRGIAIAGAHGKTTTSSMLAFVFEKSNYDPTVVIGGELNDIGGNAKLGSGEYIIAEADESDGSFLKLSPSITVVTNIEDDHLDYYGTREQINKAFYEFIVNTPTDGFAVLCVDSLGVKQLLPQLEGKVKLIKYGLFDGADYIAKDILLDGLQTKFTVENKANILGEVHLNVPGKHNICNALAAVAVGVECGLAFDDIAKSLMEFHGVHRRFQKIGECGGVSVFDDYAHHPSELKAALEAANTLKPRRVIGVFQPHRYSRTEFLKSEFGTAFEKADILVVTKIYSAGEKPIQGVSAQLIVKEVEKQTGKKVNFVANKDDVAQKLVKIVKPGDLVLTMGAGNIWMVGVKLCELLSGKKQLG